MSKTSLFSSTPAKSKNIFEFKAGKMNIDEKNWVHADKRKGLAYIYQNQDGLIHFCWKDRISGLVEDDLIVFPDETVFKRISQCTSGRVYVLKFKNSKKLFLWLQEPESDKDEMICKKVNDSLNRLPSPTSGSSVDVDSDMQSLLTGLGAAGYSMSQSEIMNILGIGSGSDSVTADSKSSRRTGASRTVAKEASERRAAKSARQMREVTPIMESISGVGGTTQLKMDELHSALSSVRTRLIEPVGVDASVVGAANIATPPQPLTKDDSNQGGDSDCVSVSGAMEVVEAVAKGDEEEPMEDDDHQQ